MKTLTGKLILSIFTAMTLSACSSPEKEHQEGTFGYDVQFLKQYTDVRVLKSEDQGSGQVLVTPTLQGRVMTSTAEGLEGKSLGWVNHELIASGEILEQFTPYGGEDRFWLGPEGGQFSVFFIPGGDMSFENWYVPPDFNTEPWKPVSHSDSQVQVEKQMGLTNFSGTQFTLDVLRTINLLNTSGIENLLGIEIPEGVNYVGFETVNSVTNTGEEAWTKETGTISIWILSMFAPAPGITVVAPYRQGPEEALGPIVTTEYFGEISDERLKVEEGVIYFKVDGKKRRKLGVSPRRALPVAGSYDETNQILTIVHYTLPEDNTEYVNQLWKQQEKPYSGDVMNAYNDGPLEDGSQLGPFYEIESSSPAALLAPGESLTHHHRVFHFTGNEQKLDEISQTVLGVGIQQIKSAF